MAKNVRGSTMTKKPQNSVLGPKEGWHIDEAQVHFCWTFKSYLFKLEGFFVVGWFCCCWFVGVFFVESSMRRQRQCKFIASEK